MHRNLINERIQTGHTLFIVIVTQPTSSMFGEMYGLWFVLHTKANNYASESKFIWEDVSKNEIIRMGKMEFCNFELIVRAYITNKHNTHTHTLATND